MMENRLTHVNISDKERSYILSKRDIIRATKDFNSRYIYITVASTLSDIILEYCTNEDASTSILCLSYVTKEIEL
jgi:hypothetical protein